MIETSWGNRYLRAPSHRGRQLHAVTGAARQRPPFPGSRWSCSRATGTFPWVRWLLSPITCASTPHAGRGAPAWTWAAPALGARASGAMVALEPGVSVVVEDRMTLRVTLIATTGTAPGNPCLCCTIPTCDTPHWCGRPGQVAHMGGGCFGGAAKFGRCPLCIMAALAPAVSLAQNLMNHTRNSLCT
jgi:hypothetical protein